MTDGTPGDIPFYGKSGRPDWETACRNEARFRSLYQAEVIHLRKAIEEIASMDYWQGVRMIEIAKQALEHR